ncbi:pyridoxal phosphate-dependent aminotransferase [Mesorhizobium sp. PL10]
MENSVAGANSSLVSDFPGGYWRYDIVDHVLLVNLYFPPSSFYRKLTERLPSLTACYPSPHWKIAEELAGQLNQHPDQLVVGNGTAELISILIGQLNLKVAVPTPSFNPYEQAALPSRLVRYELPPPHFELDVDQFAQTVVDTACDAAIVISPNNPTSRAVPRVDLLRLAERLAKEKRLLVLDESFVEFMPNGRSESIAPELDRFRNVIILKSLGKVYGACGLRFGYMLSANKELVRRVRERLSVWNINTLAEFFVSQLPNMRTEAEASWEFVRRDRDDLFERLNSIPSMKVLRPHANFVFCRLPTDWPDGPALGERLLADYSILIRHNGGKTIRDGTRYLRIATRSIPENERLVACLIEAASR